MSLNKFNKFLIKSNNLTLFKILKLNEITIKNNLVLTKKESLYLIKRKNDILKDLGRIELFNCILDKIIYEFYDSPYIDKTNYLETLENLTNVFYNFQKEFDYILTDDEIIFYLKKCFNSECMGVASLLIDISFQKLKEKIENGEKYV